MAVSARSREHILNQLHEHPIVSLPMLIESHHNASYLPRLTRRKASDPSLRANLMYHLDKLTRQGIVVRVKQGCYAHFQRMPDTRAVAAFDDPVAETVLDKLEARYPNAVTMDNLSRAVAWRGVSYTTLGAKLRKLKADGVLRKSAKQKWQLAYEPRPEKALEPEIDIFS